MKKRVGEKVLAPIHANVGLRAAYRRRLDALIEQMHCSIIYWLRAAYKATPPEMAMDATSASQMRIAINKLTRQWNRNFDEGAKELAAYFALKASKRPDAALRAILKKAGWTVRFQMTPAMKDILKATVAENTSLIKSIPSQYLTQVQGIVMRSVTAGRDLSTMTQELQKQYGVTKRRAAFISRDQNNKATAAFTRARQQELGIEYAIWQHSAGGKEPRPSHVRQSGKRYKISEGWLDPAINKYIWPGTEPNCRCVSKVIIKGFT